MPVVTLQRFAIGINLQKLFFAGSGLENSRMLSHEDEDGGSFTVSFRKRC